MSEQAGPGRPSEFKPEYCEQLIDHMAGGLSFESFAGTIRKCAKTLYNWLENHPEFLHAKEVGVEASRLWWEKTGRDHIVTISESSRDSEGGSFSSSKSLNGTVWSLNMRNRFHKEWREKQPDEVDKIINNVNQRSDEELDAIIAEKMKKLGGGE